MNKSIKIVIGILITIIIIWGIIFTIDYYRCSNMKEPIFTISKQENDLSIKSVTHQGLGYRVEVEKNVSNKYGEQITKVEMYMFSKFITGAVTDTDNSNLENEVNNNEEIKQTSFRAIVVSSNEKSIIVQPIEEQDKQILSDRVSIGLGENNDMLYFEGAELLITYTGEVMDSYPTQIKTSKIQTETDYKAKIDELPQDYSLINAIEDNCVISIHGKKLYNGDELDRFLKNVENNTPDFIRCISFTTEGDMIITDVNFEGSNSFRTCCDWTRDEWSSKEDRTYKYGRFTKLVTDETDEGTGIYLENSIEGDLKKIYVTSYEKNAQIINNYKFNYLLEIKENDKKEKSKITVNDLANKYNYDIFYYGIDNITIEINNEKMDLKEALKNDIITMEQIIEQAEKDSEAGVIGSDMYKEGGTMIYFYDTYTIIKSHSLDGNRDVFIGVPEMRLNDVR